MLFACLWANDRVNSSNHVMNVRPTLMSLLSFLRHQGILSCNMSPLPITSSCQPLQLCEEHIKWHVFTVCTLFICSPNKFILHMWCLGLLDLRVIIEWKCRCCVLFLCPPSAWVCWLCVCVCVYIRMCMSFVCPFLLGLLKVAKLSYVIFQALTPVCSHISAHFTLCLEPLPHTLSHPINLESDSEFDKEDEIDHKPASNEPLGFRMWEPQYYLLKLTVPCPMQKYIAGYVRSPVRNFSQLLTTVTPASHILTYSPWWLNVSSL